MFPSINENGNYKLGIPDKKIITFLDIDGVISKNTDKLYDHDLDKTREYLAKKYKDDTYLRIKNVDIGYAFYDWDPICLGRLRNYLDRTESEIVISSDWRDGNDLDMMRALFKIHGMDEYILDVLPEKGEKIVVIREYLEREKDNIENYVVIDDNNELSVFENHFVLVKKKLNSRNLKEAERILIG